MGRVSTRCFSELDGAIKMLHYTQNLTLHPEHQIKPRCFGCALHNFRHRTSLRSPLACMYVALGDVETGDTDMYITYRMHLSMTIP